MLVFREYVAENASSLCGGGLGSSGYYGSGMDSDIFGLGLLWGSVFLQKWSFHRCRLPSEPMTDGPCLSSRVGAAKDYFSTVHGLSYMKLLSPS